MAGSNSKHASGNSSPNYNLVHLLFLIIASSLFGLLLWQKGKERNNEQDLFNILGSMFTAVQFLGLSNCTSVIPFVVAEHIVLCREIYAGLYSPWAYSFAQVIIEIPYDFLQAVLFVAITYPAIGYYWSVYKVFWYSYATFCTLLYFTYLGMLLAVQVATVSASFCYTMFNLFTGFLIPGPKIPKWWIWWYWICPSAWSLKGLLTSQYEDITKEITVFGGEHKSIQTLQEYFGYHHDQLGVMAIVLLAFPLVFASLFCIFHWKIELSKEMMKIYR